MTIEDLINIVNSKFNLDITEKTHKRHVVYAKKVFCHIAYNLGYGHTRIVEILKLKAHRTSIHHVDTINNIYKYHKIIHNQIVLEYKLDVPLLEYKETTNNSENRIIEEIKNVLLTFNESQLIEFKKTRLLPYKQMINEFI